MQRELEVWKEDMLSLFTQSNLPIGKTGWVVCFDSKQILPKHFKRDGRGKKFVQSKAVLLNCVPHSGRKRVIINQILQDDSNLVSTESHSLASGLWPSKATLVVVNSKEDAVKWASDAAICGLHDVVLFESVTDLYRFTVSVLKKARMVIVTHEIFI